MLFLAGGLFGLWIFKRDPLLLSLWLALLLFLAISYLWTKFNPTHVSVRRFTRTRVLPAGSLFKERLEVNNSGKRAHYLLQVEDQSGLLSSIHSRAISRLGAGETRTQAIQALVYQRGFHPLGPTRISTGDPFGFFTAKLTFPAEKQLTVLPFIPTVHSQLAASGRQSGEQNLLERSPQPTPQAWGVRPYQSGDPLNRVHWPLTLKKGQMMVKEFDRDTQASLWVFLDAQAGQYIHTPEIQPKAVDWNLVPLKERRNYRLPRDGFEYALSTAAAIGKFGLDTGQSLGFASNGGSPVIYPAEKGQRQLNKVLLRMAEMRDDGELDVLILLNQQAKNIARGSRLMLISGRRNGLWEQSLQAAHHWGLKFAGIYIDPDSFQPSDARENTSSINKNIIRIGYGDDISTILSNALADRPGATFRTTASGG
ncbi:MAG: hypothetical protein PWQ55_481 [Chloroflexota bacterium]|nr:hypothetical protein [Chloroflexota bacterium]